ncbi:MAG TPA: leucine-rich repeat domain-containing protein [Dongiaceae bacterium]|nr:leucine-rich repeat domain-containing protein [Dongiaceae bacterium]
MNTTDKTANVLASTGRFPGEACPPGASSRRRAAKGPGSLVVRSGARAVLSLAAAALAAIGPAPSARAQGPFDWEAANGSVTITGFAGVGPGSATIPSTIDGLPVTAIGFGVFRGSLLTSVTIPDSIITIGDYAFDGCANLTQVSIPDSVTSIGAVAFSLCGLTSITFPNSITNLGADALAGCGYLTNVTLPDNITGLAAGVSRDCQNLPGITLPSSLTSIGYAAFYGCQSLTNITIPSGVTNLVDLAFWGCWSLTNVALPNSLATIGSGAFDWCRALTSITIPGSVTILGSNAFTACYNLANVFFEGDAPSADSSVFSEDNYATVYYLPGSKGWGATFAGRPAVLWNPGVVSPGVRDGRLSFDITGGTNLPVVVEASTNLAGGAWVPVQSGSLTNGLLHFSDPQPANYPARFYRLRWP